MTPNTARICFYAALVLAIFGLGVYVERKFSDVRYQKLELKDAASYEAALTKAAADTKALQDKANKAQSDYDEVQAALQTFTSATPLPSVRLCQQPSQVPGSKSPSTKPGVKGGVASPGTIQPMPSGDSGVRPNVGPDISGLLNALGRAADEVTNKAREQQERTK